MTLSGDKKLMSKDYLIIGQITGTHGVRGEVKVFPLTDNTDRFKNLKEVFLSDKSGSDFRKITCTGSKNVKNLVVLEFKEITDMNSAELLKGKYLNVGRENAVALPENSYFICDLIGIKAFDTSGELLGNLSEVITTGANDVYVIDRPGKKQLLLPAIKEVVKVVDLENQKIVVDILPGLEEIYD